MEELPQPLLLEILSRLHDATDLGRCRVASKTLNALSTDVRSVTIVCSIDRYIKSRVSSETPATPFKDVVKSVVRKSRRLESFSVAIEDPFAGIDDDKEAESDDLYLTSVDFVSDWLQDIAGKLGSLCISDFWTQSCWRRSEVLRLISAICANLHTLELKNAWLSVEGMLSMPQLTKLTLQFIRLDDENLKAMNECFPSLETLNLIGVGGLREPRIHLMQLKRCHWTVSSAPVSLAVHAPRLTDLKLECVQPRSLVIRSPLLSLFNISVEKSIEFIDLEDFKNLKMLRMKTSDFCGLLRLFPRGETVTNLVLEAPRCEKVSLPDLKQLISAFPNLQRLDLGPWTWPHFETLFEAGEPDLAVTYGWPRLKKLKMHLLVSNVDRAYSLLSTLLKLSTSLTNVEAVVHGEVQNSLRSSFILKCKELSPWIRCSWKG